jgi:GNAT superfamily N-acetyltransferase
MNAVLRQARREDIRAMHRVRLSVHENQLTSTVISNEDYIAAIEQPGRGWVIEVEDRVVAFAIGNSQTANVWALFVDPDCEGRGYGRKLHDVMVGWLWSQGLKRLWLTTGPGTRAERFYRAAGWIDAGYTERGEMAFELREPGTLSDATIESAES